MIQIAFETSIDQERSYKQWRKRAESLSYDLIFLGEKYAWPMCRLADILGHSSDGFLFVKLQIAL